MIDFSKYKVNCSQIGHLMGNGATTKPPTEVQMRKCFDVIGKEYEVMTEAQKYKAREILTKAILYDPKGLSQGIITDLVHMYAYEKYGKGKVSKGNDSPLQLIKGSMAEPEAIKALSKIDGIEYEKNEKMYENDFIKGIPDIIVKDAAGKPEKIIEVKTSYDLPAYILAMMNPEEKKNIYELMGYMDLLKCKKGEIVHVLVDMPAGIKNFEEKRMIDHYKSLNIEPGTIAAKVSSRLSDMEYSDIPPELKISRRSYTASRYVMKPVKSRVRAVRSWLVSMDSQFTKNLVNLSEQIEPDQED